VVLQPRTRLLDWARRMLAYRIEAWPGGAKVSACGTHIETHATEYVRGLGPGERHAVGIVLGVRKQVCVRANPVGQRHQAVESVLELGRCRHGWLV